MIHCTLLNSLNDRWHRLDRFCLGAVSEIVCKRLSSTHNDTQGGNLFPTEFATNSALAGTSTRGHISLRISKKPNIKLDRATHLVQFGAYRCTMAKHRPQKRFSVSLDQVDYEAMRSIADKQEPSLTLQYVINLAVKEFLIRRQDAQLEIPLTIPQRIRQ